ncbi:MAG: CBS domain-containing protein [Leptolyngbya sp. SIO1D8]|nr:CBS domain-containing protein [Leptolyngbya sp. SIO1D8]
MSFQTSLSWVPQLEDAIEHDPLVVPPEMPLTDAIALISQAHHHTCWVTEGIAEPPVGKGVRASCVLVTQDNVILGILTERDVVRLTAQSIDLQASTVADVMVHPVITLPERSVQDIFAVLFLFRRYRIRHVPIVDDQGLLVGVISHESVRQVLRPANLLRFRRVSDVMTTEVIHAPLTHSVLQLAQLMATHRVSCVVITQPDEEDTMQPVGIVTERDIVQFQALQIDFNQTQAQQVMSSPLFLLSPKDSLWTAHQEMQKRRVGRLVVSWNWGQGLGLVTQTSLLRIFDPMEMYGVIENLQQTLQQLEPQEGGQETSSPAAQPKRQTPMVDSQASLTPQQAPLPETSLENEREPLSIALSHLHATLQKIVDDQHSSLEQTRSQLRTVLTTLEHLQNGMNR